MPYEQDDPRSQLATAPRRTGAVGACVAPQYFEFGVLEPDEVTGGGTKTWYVRSQSCCLAFSAAAAGDTLVRDDQPDEYMVLFPAADAEALITVGDGPSQIKGTSAVVVPPGTSGLTMRTGGVVVRIFSTRAHDLRERCRNAAVYEQPDPNVAPFEPWPDAPGPGRLRVYRLDEFPPDPERFGRILRCSTIMVNYFYPDDGARDPAKLSPHHHDDFEQISLQLEGDYVHHIRTPWTANLADWRDDDHRFCASPAVTIIPPPAVHTSQSVNDMRHQLVDVFCPPRIDFSERPGWVLNHTDYPMP